MPDIDQTVPWGKRGKIDYKPNWGQPIVDGQWRGAGAAQPAASAIDPREIVNTRMDSLWDNYKRQFKTLEDANLGVGVFNRAASELRNKYDQAKAEETGMLHQLDQIEQIVSAGGISPDAGYKAGAKLTLSKPVYDKMFPTPKAEPTPSATGYTPGTYQTLVDWFTELGERSLAYKDKAWYRWDVKQIDSETIKELYEAERRIANLNDPRNANRIPGFNAAFAEGMAADTRTEKVFNKLMDKKTGDIDMIRWFAPSSRLTNIVNEKIDGKPVTPLAQSIVAAKFKGAGAGMTYPYMPKRATAKSAVKPITRQFSVGQTIERGGKKYRVVSFDTDGEPMVEETR